MDYNKRNAIDIRKKEVVSLNRCSSESPIIRLPVNAAIDAIRNAAIPSIAAIKEIQCKIGDHLIAI